MYQAYSAGCPLLDGTLCRNYHQKRHRRCRVYSFKSNTDDTRQNECRAQAFESVARIAASQQRSYVGRLYDIRYNHGRLVDINLSARPTGMCSRSNDLNGANVRKRYVASLVHIIIVATAPRSVGRRLQKKTDYRLGEHLLSVSDENTN